MRILFTGGGTGGHIYPIVSVAEKIIQAHTQAQTPADLYYVGVPGAYEQLLASRGITVFSIASAKMRSGDFLRNIVDIPSFFISLVQAMWRVFFIMPDVLFSKGGPGALPVVLACAFYRIPIIVHESDSVAGLTNRISGRFAKRIGIAFTNAKSSFISETAKEYKRVALGKKIAFIGNPIRELFFSGSDSATKADAKRFLDFDATKPLVLIMGGSQGSVRINDFFLSIAEELLNRNIQIVHQVGVKNFDSVRAQLTVRMEKYSDTFRRAYRIVPYFEKDIKDVYLATDLVISRAGSGSIFEMAAMGCPAILIPLPESAHNHQVKNAFEYSSTGAAITIEESNLTKNIFLTQFEHVMANPEMLASMSRAAKAFSHPDAAQVLAEEIIRLAR